MMCGSVCAEKCLWIYRVYADNLEIRIWIYEVDQIKRRDLWRTRDDRKAN